MTHGTLFHTKSSKREDLKSCDFTIGKAVCLYHEMIGTSHYCLWYILTFHTVFYQFINSRCSFAQSAPPPDCRLPRQSRTSCSWAVTSLGHGSGAGRGAGSADGDLRQTELDPWQLHLPPLVASVYQLLCLCLLDQH